ncbi:MAG TPA: 30S ribosomal protein S12 methylthiotransferase RimO [Bryobacteraceae bacterium]|jgi:ribosomal protein S12 methylthiotransferase|nr:30S ribosomal protein S12 methylthiotransferase RimO [Bryobacteraceae bacterium]
MKVGFVSLGCPKNLVDSEVMMGQLAARGHELTPHPDQADVLVVNTCSFIDPAKQESVDTILEMAEYKKVGRAQRLVVAGCLVERYRGDIRKDMPEVDAIIGTNEVERIVEVCEGIDSPVEAAPYLYHDLTPRILATPRHFAYMKIAEGCDHPCSFCVIPQYRGKFRSRRFESVISEATRLFSQGVREINLIGQDTTCYGEDLGIKDGLAQLLARLAQIETPMPKWVRFLYAYPNKVTQKLLDTIAEHRDLVKYIDMPLQHASAQVLKRMKRGASGDIFLKLIERIRRTIPGVAIRTSFIAGFPGETAADFDTLCQFIEAAQFERLGVFSYSDEDTSGSYALDGKVDGRTIANRKRRLMAIQRRISRAKNRQMVGREVAVLVEGRSPDTDLLWQARMSTQAPEIDGTVLINDVEGAEPAPGQMRRLRITEAHDYDLIGTLLASTEAEARAPAQVVQAPVLVHIAQALPDGAPAFVIPDRIPVR